MISNITNALPVFLKQMKNNINSSIKQSFSLIQTIKFYNSIFPKDMKLNGLKHIYLDIKFKLRDDAISAFNNFMISVDTLEFLKQFKYILDRDFKTITIRGNVENFAILSLILIGSIKNIGNENQNKSIFISMCAEFLKYCLNNDYKVCQQSDIQILTEYNEGFNESMFEKCIINPTLESDVATFHFVGIELNKDILIIFENYKNVIFSYNYENASFIITMESKNWDQFWNKAPEYLRKQLSIEKKNK